MLGAHSRLGVAIAVGFTAALVGPALAAPVSRPHVTVELVADVTAVAPGDPFRLGVHFAPEAEWHVYWRNPGDSGEAPRITWTLPAGIAAGETEWPAPVRLETDPIVSFGYAGDVLLAAPIRGKATASGDALDLKALAKWLVCNRDECIPGSAELTLTLPVGAGGAPSPAAPLFEAMRTRLPAPAPAKWHAEATGEAAHIILDLHGAQIAADVHPIFFPHERDAFDAAGPQVVTHSADGIRISVARRAGARLPERLGGVLDLGDRAYAIEAPLAIAAARAAGATGEATGLAAMATPIALAFLGGLLLNLMPCVFPVLALKALALVGLAGEARRRVRSHGLVYALGIVVSFWVLAGLLLAARAGGAELGWGFQLQSPTVIAVLAGLFFWMALVLLDLVTVGSAIMGVGQHLTTGDGHRAAFFTGVLATVVATPCTAPFMGTAIGYALAQPAAVALAVFTSLGLGLAAPYVAITFVPALAARLPRPGAWMETLKQLLAFPLLATVVWLVWVASVQAGPPAVLVTLLGLVLLAFAAWAVNRWPSAAGRWVATAAVGAAIVLAATIAPVERTDATASRAVASGDAFQWEAFSPRRVSELRTQGRPVFVDFTAAWCVTCQVNKKVALETKEVTDKMRELGVVAMRADWTRPDPEISRALQEFGRDGVPLYVLYAGNAEPRILPQILTPTIVITELEQLKGRSST